MRLKERYSAMVAVGLCTVLWVALHVGDHRIAHENGLMENQQALCLGFAGLLFVAAARRSLTRAEKFFCIFLSLFCFTFLLRELEIKGEPVPSVLESLLTGKLRRFWVTGCWLILLYVARDCWRNLFSLLARWVRTPAGLLMIVSGVLYALTWPFDKGLFGLPKPLNMFLEELGDSIATMLMLLSGLWTWSADANLRPASPLGVGHERAAALDLSSTIPARPKSFHGEERASVRS